MKYLQLLILLLASISSLFLAAAIGPRADTLLFQGIEPSLGRRATYLAVTLFDVGFIYLTLCLLLETKKMLKEVAMRGSAGMASDGA
jgi:hypothetical protein